MMDVPQSQPLATMPSRTAGKLALSVAGYSVLVALMLVSPLFVFLPAALFHCAVRNGRGAAWVVLPIGAAMAALAVMQTSPSAAGRATELGLLLAVILGVAVPALLVLPLVERGASFGRVLIAAVIAGMIGLVAAELIVQKTTGVSLYASQVASAKGMAADMLSQREKTMSPDNARMLRKWTDLGVYCLPAMLLIYISLFFVLSLVMFGRLRAWREFVETRQIDTEAPYLFRKFSLPEWVLFAFIVGGLTPLASGLAQRVSANVLAVVAFLYLLQGLAIFRSVLVSVGANFGAVLFAYGALVLLTLAGVAPLLLSIAGLFDSFFDFRHFNRKDSTHEGHSD